MSTLADRFVGRAEDLGVLDQMLGDLATGRPAVLELLGEPGIGKTRLLRELGARADARGLLVVSGSGSELERDLPFSIFVDALDDYLGSLQPQAFADLAEGVRTELAHLFPSMSLFGSARAVAVQHERYRSHRAVRVLLEHLAARTPLVLLLDDIHWADSASVELLGALLRRPPNAPVVIVLALRPRQLPDRLSAALERAYREGRLTRIELAALSPDEARELLGGTIGVADAAVLYDESGGNPFYLEQLARAPERGGGAAAPDKALAEIGVPAAVAAALTEELAMLSDASRLVLDGAAVAGDPFDLELTAAAAGVRELAAMDAIDELLRLDLVRGTDVPRRFRFRHPLVRRAVYVATSGGWRLGAHERCAEALAARGAAAPARAHHVVRSAREGDRASVDILREAGEETARLAPASAAHWFEEALRLLPENAPAPERVELLLARANALTAVGQFALSHDALLAALSAVPNDADALRARVVRACAGVESNLGRHEEAAARLTAALAGLPDPRSPEAAALLIELSVNGLWRTRYDVMKDAGERAVAVAGSLGDAPLLAAALAVLAFAESVTGSADRAAVDLSEAAALVDALSDDELATRLDAATWVSGTELYLDRFEAADGHASRALAVGRATGQGEFFLVLVQTLSRVWFVRGKLAEAVDLLDGGIEAARLLGNSKALAWNLLNRSVFALAGGDLELALATAQESVDLTRGLDATFHAAWAAVRLAGVLLEQGDAQTAADLIVGSAGGEEISLIPGSSRAYCLELLARCWLALDRNADADRAAARAQSWAAAVRLPLAAAWADRAAAAVALHGGEAERAAERALAAAAAAEGTGAPTEAALARTLAGRALAEAGNNERAVAELQRAARVLDACGAVRYRDAAERELGKLGRRTYRRTRATNDGGALASLTERELQISRLVVDRRTNPQIAAELFLSQKTVETHLRNIFRKLDVGSRVELARVVERADRTASAAAQ